MTEYPAKRAALTRTGLSANPYRSAMCDKISILLSLFGNKWFDALSY